MPTTLSPEDRMDETNAPMVRSAATVALVRDGVRGLEAWMMRRTNGMAFAAGAVVFPGGRVDQADADPSIAWHGDTTERFAERLDVDASVARAVVTAAVRELFEEAGVLLTAPRVSSDVELARMAVEGRTRTFASLLAEHGCAVDVSGLLPWGRWVTPPGEIRRFDTWFFVAAAPPELAARSATSEAASAGWVEVGDVLDRASRGEFLLLPPTIVMLRGLVAAATVAGVRRAAASRSMEPVHPQITYNDDGTITVLGGGEQVLVRP
jgi:8-oxo-dGTP pyrophosphatase MutT (NUDIX family)